MNFRETIEQIEQISTQLREQGITVEKLDQAIRDLKEHQSNIEKIEQNIDAIKKEVLSPLQQELEQNRTAGKFSIFGFWVGAVGLVVSIGTVVFQQSSSTVVQRLDLIEHQSLFPERLKVEAGETFVERGHQFPVATSGDTDLSITVEYVTDYPRGEGIKGGLKLSRGAYLIGKISIEGNLVRSDGATGFRPWFDDETIAVDKGDVLKLGNAKVEIVRILARESKGRPIGDEKDGILFRVSSEN